MHTKAIVGGRNITTIDKDIMVGEILLSGINHAICKDYIRDKVLYPFDNLRGILLTPELLKKYGFVRFGSSNPFTTQYLLTNDDCIYIFIGFISNGFNEDDQSGCCELSYATDPSRKKYGRKIEFFHQLQNLYYNLTGEELKVNL